MKIGIANNALTIGAIIIANVQLSVESNPRLHWFWFTTLCNWSRKLAPPSQPIRFKTELMTRVFPRFRPVTCIYFESDWFLVIFTVKSTFNQRYRVTINRTQRFQNKLMKEDTFLFGTRLCLLTLTPTCTPVGLKRPST